MWERTPVSIRTRQALLGFTLTLVAACGAATVVVPAALVGEWRTDEARYADRYVRFEPEGVVRLGQGEEGELEGRIIRLDLESEQPGGKQRYLLEYLGDDGQEYEVTLEHRSTRGTLLIGGNQRVTWRREVGS